MVKVFPFKGISYNKKKIKNLSKVMAPPYDVISPEMQDDFYEENEFNVIRLILGKEFPNDGQYNNRYIRAAAFLNGWLRHKILLQDEKPCFYAYEQRFSCQGKKYSRIGFFSTLRLEDIGRGKVYPHEETYSKAKLDRLEIMRATSANLESIFAFYSDKKDKIIKIIHQFTRRKPYLEVKDKDGTIHRLWKIDRKAAINKIVAEMKDKPVFIADGHHRYEAALRYRNELKAKNTKFTEDEAYNHILIYLTPLEGTGLTILPIHRAVKKLEFFNADRFTQELSQYFEVVPFEVSKRQPEKGRKNLLKALAKKREEGKHAFAVYLGNNRHLLITLRDEESLDEMVAEEKPKAWKRLDATILHYVIFERIFSIAHETEEHVVYYKDPEDAAKAVDNNEADVVFYLNPTKIEEIVAVAGELEKMPHKSTYFYPKLLSGLIMNKYSQDEKIKL